MNRPSWISLALIALLCAAACQQGPEHDRMNVLFISIDDLRPSLGAYGFDGAHTPHLDALAARGTRFDRAYCQMATCAPSRAAVLTGCRPATNGVVDLKTHYRDALPDAVTLPQLFKEKGWYAAAFGKVHHGRPEDEGELDDAISWSTDCWRPADRWQTYYATEAARTVMRENEARAEREGLWAVPRGLSYEAPDVPDSELGDGRIADAAIAAMEAHRDEPFFLAVGFLKPHMPYVAPKKYWDLYPPNSESAPIDEGLPDGSPTLSTTDSAEVRSHHDIPNEGPIPDDLRRELRRGYLACASYVDAQVGRLLATLERLGLDDSTIVVVWGDHGWHLGEQGHLGKHTNFETSTRVPLLVHVPGRDHVQATDALVELVDLYPTLAELCGLVPPTPIEGTSFASNLFDRDAPRKSAVFHEFHRGKQAKGYAVRTDTHRLVQWTRADGAVVEELYDLAADPRETLNVVESQAGVAGKLRAVLARGWRAAVPEDSGSEQQ